MKGYKLLVKLPGDENLYSIPSLALGPGGILGRKKKWVLGKKYRYRGEISLCQTGYHMFTEFNVHEIAQVYEVGKEIDELVICEAEGGGKASDFQHLWSSSSKAVFQAMTITKILGRIKVRPVKRGVSYYRGTKYITELIHQIDKEREKVV